MRTGPSGRRRLLGGVDLVGRVGDDRWVGAVDVAKSVDLSRAVGELLHEDSQRPAIRARLSVMLGFEAPESVMPDTPAQRVDKELAWGIRRYLQALAQQLPAAAGESQRVAVRF